MEALIHTPFFGICLSVSTFILGRWIQKKTGWLLANPVVTSTGLIIAVLLLFGISYEEFALGGDIIGLLMAPVTAVLALGIYNQRKVLKEYFLPVLVGCTVGSASSILSVLGLCRLFGVDKTLAASLLPKSCTSAIAISVAESHGGMAAIAALAVMFTGITGALCAPLFAKWFHITDPVAQGLATGASSHALGTTKAREMGELQGAMSGLAIGICGLISVILTLFV